MEDEKFEAMRQTLELLMRMHLDNEKRFAANEDRMGPMMNAITRLANVVISHDERLDNLEGH